MKTPFTLDAWLKDKSRKVTTESGEPVKIVFTDGIGSRPVLAVIYDGDTTDSAWYAADGTDCHGEQGLFLVTDEPETPAGLIEQLKYHLAGLSHEEKMKEWEEICALCPDTLEDREGKANGSNAPVWDEERNGVYIPILNIVLQAKNLRYGIVNFHNWAKANELAEAAGGRLFTRDEAYILLYWKDAINALLRERGGDPLDDWTWTGSSRMKQQTIIDIIPCPA